MTTYTRMATALDAWAGYHGNTNDTVRRVSATLVDAWGRLPTEFAAKLASDMVVKYSGKTEPRSLALIEELAKIRD